MLKKNPILEHAYIHVEEPDSCGRGPEWPQMTPCTRTIRSLFSQDKGKRGQGESYTQPDKIGQHQILAKNIKPFPAPFLLACSTVDYRKT
jgi:hypothetical protein